MKVYLTILILISFALGSFGQKGIVFYSKNRMQIGQQTSLTIVLENPPTNFKYESLIGEISCSKKQANENLWKNDGLLEILRFEDTVISQKGKKQWFGKYTLTAWDTGQYIFPTIQLTYNDSVISLPTPLLEVNFVKGKIDFSVKEVPVKVESDRWLWFKRYGVWITLLLLILLTLFLINRRTRTKFEVPLSVKEKYKLKIQELRKEELWLNNKTEEHYIRFSKLLRTFLSEVYQINLLRQTSEETLLLLKVKKIHVSDFEKIKTVLQQADLVKFAKNSPNSSQAEEGLLLFDELVAILSPIDVPLER